MDKMREEFEKWCVRNGYLLDTCELGYSYIETAEHWETWQACAKVMQEQSGEAVAWMKRMESGRVMWRAVPPTHYANEWTPLYTRPQLAPAMLDGRQSGVKAATYDWETAHLKMAKRAADLEVENNKLRQGIEALRIVQQPTPIVPDGWKLVPVEPTKEMIDAAFTTSSSRISIYEAMLAAAPSARRFRSGL